MDTHNFFIRTAAQNGFVTSPARQPTVVPPPQHIGAVARDAALSSASGLPRLPLLRVTDQPDLNAYVASLYSAVLEQEAKDKA